MFKRNTEQTGTCESHEPWASDTPPLTTE